MTKKGSCNPETTGFKCPWMTICRANPREQVRIPESECWVPWGALSKEKFHKHLQKHLLPCSRYFQPKIKRDRNRAQEWADSRVMPNVVPGPEGLGSTRSGRQRSLQMCTQGPWAGAARAQRWAGKGCGDSHDPAAAFKSEFCSSCLSLPRFLVLANTLGGS